MRELRTHFITEPAQIHGELKPPLSHLWRTLNPPFNEVEEEIKWEFLWAGTPYQTESFVGLQMQVVWLMRVFPSESI